MSQSNTVYLVDDDLDVRDTLTNIFHFNGYKVKAFADPVDALKHPLNSIDSCILLDLNMPHMSGLLFQRELMKRNLAIPIVIYSGTASVNTAVSAMSEGAFTVLQKPAKKELLLATVNSAIAEFKGKQAEKLLNKRAAEQLLSLSTREYEIALLISEGFTSPAIAEKLHISTRTVEAHRAAIFLKLNVKATGPLAQLILRADMHNNQAPSAKSANENIL